MHSLPKDRRRYEDRYDHTTIFIARLKMKSFMDMHAKWLEIMPENEENKYRTPWHLNHIYMSMVGSRLVERYDDRERAALAMMAEDEARDTRIASARLTSEPVCEHCGKSGLRIKDKTFMNRDGRDEDGILFIFHCAACDKNTAIWEDGSAWEHRHTKCLKCNAIMGETSKRRADIITTTYVCPNCSHTYKGKLDLKLKDEPEDPDYEEDRRIYCLQDETMLKEHREGKYRLEDLIKFAKEHKEKEDNKHIYDAVKEMKRPKIAELTLLLHPVLEKVGYIDFSLDKPEIGKDVFVGFNCLDSKSDRDDYDSQKTLEKLVKKTLEPTNWRLMSDGVSYRLGYLNGRVRAYEREEDLKNLVMKDMKLAKLRKEKANHDDSKSQYKIKGEDGEDTIL